MPEVLRSATDNYKSHQLAYYHVTFIYSKHQFKFCSFESSPLRQKVIPLIFDFMLEEILFNRKFFDFRCF